MICIGKPKILAKNLIIGQFTIDIDGIVKGIDYESGYTIEVNYVPQKGKV